MYYDVVCYADTHVVLNMEEAMCARFIVLDEAEIAEMSNIVREIGLKYDGKGLSMKIGEVFPTDNAAVVAMQNSKPELCLMKWGFPKWDGKGVIINAKSETAAEKRMFSASLKNQRCVVPSTGFFEWANVDGRIKQKFRLNFPDEPMLYMGGLYANFPESKSSESLIERFVILTRAANSDIADIHNRMPVVLRKNEITRWLTDLSFAAFIMKRDSERLVRAAS